MMTTEAKTKPKSGWKRILARVLPTTIILFGAVLTTKGADWGFGAGVVICLIHHGSNTLKKDAESLEIRK